jgi:phospholipase/lecithinase/hemolysin
MREQSERAGARYFDDMLHPSEAGHRYIAERIYDKLVDEGLLQAAREQ